MTYLKILMYARAGIQAKIDEYRGMQEKALEGAGSHAGAQALGGGQLLVDGVHVLGLSHSIFLSPRRPGRSGVVFDGWVRPFWR